MALVLILLLINPATHDFLFEHYVKYTVRQTCERYNLEDVEIPYSRYPYNNKGYYFNVRTSNLNELSNLELQSLFAELEEIELFGYFAQLIYFVYDEEIYSIANGEIYRNGTRVFSIDNSNAQAL